MDGILNQERRLLTKYNQERSLLGHNIGMEVYSQKQKITIFRAGPRIWGLGIQNFQKMKKIDSIKYRFIAHN
jgi:hypothetical protein